MIGRMNVVVSAGPCWHCWLGRLALACASRRFRGWLNVWHSPGGGKKGALHPTILNATTRTDLIYILV